MYDTTQLTLLQLVSSGFIWSYQDIWVDTRMKENSLLLFLSKKKPKQQKTTVLLGVSFVVRLVLCFCSKQRHIKTSVYFDSALQEYIWS